MRHLCFVTGVKEPHRYRLHEYGPKLPGAVTQGESTPGPSTTYMTDGAQAEPSRVDWCNPFLGLRGQYRVQQHIVGS
jgi:hypothetical protein